MCVVFCPGTCVNGGGRGLGAVGPSAALSHNLSPSLGLNTPAHLERSEASGGLCEFTAQIREPPCEALRDISSVSAWVHDDLGERLLRTRLGEFCHPHHTPPPPRPTTPRVHVQMYVLADTAK